jgi:hypothetical protein
MSTIGDQRYRERLVRYRYLHCRMRLQERYGLELDEDEYQKLCRKFANQEWPGAWRTDTGAMEAWIEFQGKLVCAHYRPNERLITTFQKPPTEEPAALKEAAEPKAARQAKEISRLLKLNEELQRRCGLLPEDRSKESAEQLEGQVQTLRQQITQLQQQRVTVNQLDREIGWYKQRVNDAIAFLKDGQPLQGVAVLEALVGLPKRFRSQLDPGKATELLFEVAKYRRADLGLLYEEVRESGEQAIG